MKGKENLKSKKKYIGGYKTRTDYDMIYRKVLAVSPGMQGIVEYVKNVVPIRYKEYEDLCNAIVNKSDNMEYAKSRLFDTNLHFAVKNALYAWEKFGIDLEDAFQISCIGILKAIDKYNFGVKGRFSSYTSAWMRQIMERERYVYNRNVAVSRYYSWYIDKTISQLEKETGKIDFNTISSKELYNLLLQYTDCNEEESSCICRIMTCSLDIDEIEEDEVSNIIFEEEIFDTILDKISCGSIWDTLYFLSKREREILRYRSQDMTLDEIAKIYCVTRERVRQIESKAKFRLINHFTKTGQLRKFLFWEQ